MNQMTHAHSYFISITIWKIRAIWLWRSFLLHFPIWWTHTNWLLHSSFCILLLIKLIDNREIWVRFGQLLSCFIPSILNISLTVHYVTVYCLTFASVLLSLFPLYVHYQRTNCSKYYNKYYNPSFGPALLYLK